MHRVSNGSVASGDSRRNSMVDACGRFCSQPTNGAPELLIALCYDTDHGCLTVGIERGSSLGEKSRPQKMKSWHFTKSSIRGGDTFIKIVALGEFGNELWRQKTELVKGTSEPQYDHTASIQVGAICRCWEVASGRSLSLKGSVNINVNDMPKFFSN
ncbi:hypothetical protein OESDEN_16595 [Oesophagostomum dentatum]|uniref:C2 domain-containing protein n=1 Tax=Oesophagostomum dentatum TaxID=61180 RepID=A0A0B1SFL1_OESDE|nr:hypothetical protein OESDEN_16595 [Oesophagostomum dentatum]